MLHQWRGHRKQAQLGQPARENLAFDGCDAVKRYSRVLLELQAALLLIVSEHRAPKYPQHIHPLDYDLCRGRGSNPHDAFASQDFKSLGAAVNELCKGLAASM